MTDGDADHELLLDFSEIGLCREYRLAPALSIRLFILLTVEVSNMTDFLFLKPVIMRKLFRKPDPVDPRLESISEMIEGAFDSVGELSEWRVDLVTGRRSLEEQDVGAVDSEMMELLRCVSEAIVIADSEDEMPSISAGT